MCTVDEDNIRKLNQLAPEDQQTVKDCTKDKHTRQLEMTKCNSMKSGFHLGFFVGGGEDCVQSAIVCEACKVFYVPYAHFGVAITNA